MRLVSASNHTKCVFLSNQKCMVHPTLINLYPNEYSQELHYYPSAAKLDRCVESCSTLNDLSIKLCVPYKTEDLNLSVFNIITRINKSKTLKNYILLSMNVNLMEENASQINGEITINVDLSVKNVKYVKKYMFGIQLNVVMKMKKLSKYYG